MFLVFFDLNSFENKFESDKVEEIGEAFALSALGEDSIRQILKKRSAEKWNKKLTGQISGSSHSSISSQLLVTRCLLCPGGHSHENEPTELMHLPPAHSPGMAAHSSISWKEGINQRMHIHRPDPTCHMSRGVSKAMSTIVTALRIIFRGYAAYPVG